MPKRSRSGDVSSPARVVAPTSVKGWYGELDRARRRALADHDVELEVLDRRIQDFLDHRAQAVNLVDEQHVVASRFVSSAARSPGRSSTGPGGWRMFTPSSFAMMCASVVLPRPGGPNISVWSSASPRCRAAAMKIWHLRLHRGWPMYSSSRRGRTARSNASSSGMGIGVTTRSSSAIGPQRVPHRSATRCTRRSASRIISSVLSFTLSRSFSIFSTSPGL